MCAMLLDPNQPNQCFTASLVRARERQIRAPKIGILRVFSTCSYTDNVTVYPYNRHIRGTNPIVRHVMSLTCTLERMHASQHAPKHAATQPLHDSNTRAPAPNLVWHQRSKIKGAQSRRVGSYSYTYNNVTVYPYNVTTDTLQVKIDPDADVCKTKPPQTKCLPGGSR